MTSPRLTSAYGRERVIVAHRGMSCRHPENTRSAIMAAAAIADYVEVDVHLTADRQLAVIHDRTPRRTTNAHLVWPERCDDPISTFAAAELAELDAGSWYGEPWAGEQVLMLAEVAAMLAPTSCGMFVEIKDEDSLETVVHELEEIRTSLPNLRLAIGSIQPSITAAAHRLLPSLPSGALLLDELNDAERLADLREFCSFAAFRNDLISSGLVARGHAMGLQITHNTNTRSAMRYCMSHPVDATMSDSPDRAADPCAGADLEAESLPTRSSPDAKVTVRGSKGLDYKSSGLADLCLTGRPGDWVEFSFTTGAAQRLATITLNGGPDGGAVELELAGTPVGQVVDTFRPSPARITLDLDLALTAGEHTLRMTITDPTPPRHVTCQVAVDYLSLSD